MISALVLKLPLRMNLAALWHRQSSVLPQTRSLTTQAAEEVGQDDVSIPAEPSTSKPHKKYKSKKQQPIAPMERMIADMDEDVEVNLEETQAKAYNLDLQHSEKVLNMQNIDKEEPVEVEEASAPRRRKGVIIQDPEETTALVIVHTDVLSKDKGKEIIIEEPKPLKCQAQIEKDEAFARQLEAELNANINWNDVIEQSEIRPLFEKQYNSIQAFLEKVEEEVIVQVKEIEEEGNKRQGESLKQEIAKKQRMDERAEELKRHPQIAGNDDDDVYTEATPLASKFLVVDYQIHHENNKPYYKIIRANGTQKLFLSFITLLKNLIDKIWRLFGNLLKKGVCTVKCQTCNKIGYLTKNYKNKGPATGINMQLVSVVCHACGKKGHYNYQCSKANNRAIGEHIY
nr:reverse transcriptase domain-containing protein [Tanacetum cinerariifolium]